MTPRPIAAHARIVKLTWEAGYPATRVSMDTPLSRAVIRATQDALGSPIIMCHISHAYETGASLYFTVLTQRHTDPVTQWQRAKTAATAAIVARVRT